MNKRTSYLFLKRTIDIIATCFMLLAFSPFLLVSAVAIKLDSNGPVLFKQTRLGRYGAEFTMYKFRTMCVGAEHMGTGQYSFEGDSRVTKVGKFLRITSLDELPQLINILKGEMSLIGPRPTLTYHPWTFEEYTEEQKKRFDVRPGITGYAQINGRKAISWPSRIDYDVYYVRNLSLKMDVKIFIKTLISVFKREDNVNISRTAEK